MDSRERSKSHKISDKRNILAQADAHIGILVEHASRLRLSVPVLDRIVKNRKGIQRSFVQCRPLSKQQKPFKCFPLEELESALAE
jgi:hypothetical protein